MGINNYTQEETTKIVNNMYSAGRRTSNVIVRKAIEKMNLPIEVQQRTSAKDPSVTPVMILFRTDDSEGADE